MILDRIVSRTRERLLAMGPLPAIDSPYRPRSLKEAILQAADRNAVIAELKYASPTRGTMGVTLGPEDLAWELVAGGAIALSVLTEPHFFGGSPEFLGRVRKCVDVPLLRKDFIIDLRQLYETRALQADVVLLIARVLGSSLPQFVETAGRLGLESLVEVHSRDEIPLALESGAELIGINNRDLDTGRIDLSTTERLSRLVDDGNHLIVSESGICWPYDISYLREYCDAYLIGSAIASSPSPRRRVEGFVCA
jgi:indole-3-glycerol phosphate synthase